jgi:hypothetical protein
MRNSIRLLAGLLVAQAALAADGNLLSNGDFSQQSQLTGWSCFNSSWSNDDAASSAGSGSMELHEGSNVAGHCTSSCMAVRPGSAFSLGGHSRVLFGTPVISFACAQAGTDHCNSLTYDIQGPTMSTANVWNNEPAVATGILTGLSVMCTVTLGSADLGSISGHFDNLFFTTDDIFFGEFEVPAP